MLQQATDSLHLKATTLQNLTSSLGFLSILTPSCSSSEHSQPWHNSKQLLMPAEQGCSPPQWGAVAACSQSGLPEQNNMHLHTEHCTQSTTEQPVPLLRTTTKSLALPACRAGQSLWSLS